MRGAGRGSRLRALLVRWSGPPSEARERAGGRNGTQMRDILRRMRADSGRATRPLLVTTPVTAAYLADGIACGGGEAGFFGCEEGTAATAAQQLP